MIEVTLGIDPGLTGAISMFVDGKFHCLWDMPTQVRSITRKRVTRGKMKGQMKNYEKREVDGRMLAAIISDAQAVGTVTICLELVSAMRKPDDDKPQGTSSTFSLGDSYGSARAASEIMVTAHNVYKKVPTVWKRHFNLLKKPKDASRLLAVELIPDAAHLLQRKKDDGRADALLIGLYLVQTKEK